VADVHSVCFAPRMKSRSGVRTSDLGQHCHSILA
jgi:hypothetical protein